jgi:diacylglycerol kinase family enzyme
MERADFTQTHWFIIVNPAAGSGQAARRWPEIYPQLGAVLPRHEVVFSRHRGHIAELVAEAAAIGHRHFLAVGGDGSMHELVNGVMTQTAAPSTDFLIALLPIGTGNDWIKTYNIPLHFDAWLKVFRQGLIGVQSAGLVRFNDPLGRRSSRYFVNIAGMAYDGFVVRYTSRSRPPRWSGKLFYLLAILRCLFSYNPQRGRLYCDGAAVEQTFYTIHAGIGRFAGGGMQPTPHAQPQGQVLGVMHAGPVGRWGVIRALPLFFNGAIGTHPLVETPLARRLYLEEAGDGPIPLEADGEFLGYTPVEIEVAPGALRFVGMPFSEKA